MSNRVIAFGEALLRLSTPGFLRIIQANTFNVSFGGAEVNVAVSLARFGLDVDFVTRIPSNEIGDACLDFFRRHGVGLDMVIRGGERLGLFYYETGAAQRPSLVLYDRAHSSISTTTLGMINWKQVFKDASWFHFTGITPALSESVAEVCLEALMIAKQMGLCISCDLNYRSKLWKWGKDAIEVMPELVKFCDVLIGNEEDAEKVLGVSAPETDILSGEIHADKYRFVCEEIVKQYPNITTIATTLRGSLSASHNTWSGSLWHKDKYYFGPTHDILPIVDRLGGGDSFAAGLIYGMTQFQDNIQKALDFAVAASCLKHSIQDDLNLISLAEVEKLMSGDSSGRVSR